MTPRALSALYALTNNNPAHICLGLYTSVRMDHTRAHMSTMNRFLSRKDKHRHGNSKENVMSSPTFKPSSPSTSTHASSTRSRQSSGSSFSSLSLAFSDLRAKRSPHLQTTEGTVECSSTDRGTFLLQPKSNGGPLNGLFVADGEKRSIEKDEEKKVRPRVLGCCGQSLRRG